ncbi:uncharacterized protein LOC107013182 [Solanum pennellii]|uniref:Uncharacterized protein LOC107013182 n=1 Tax=Solanum pennellii TaxID=28526 RepID=A0ABM1GBG0_SOLPN|nr:uncharacterized protein LOC107013182 [Solanum pennellii]
MNGAVEATNKNIKKILRKMIDNHRGWHEMLPYALLGYRTNVRMSIGDTPYLLVYGTEAVISVEVEIPCLRIIQKAELSNAEWVSRRIDQLTLIDEKRIVVVFHDQLYRQRLIRDFHKRVRTRIFEVGYLVLKRIFFIKTNTRENTRQIGKDPTWFTRFIALLRYQQIPPIDEYGEVEGRRKPSLNLTDQDDFGDERLQAITEDKGVYIDAGQ